MATDLAAVYFGPHNRLMARANTAQDFRQVLDAFQPQLFQRAMLEGGGLLKAEVRSYASAGTLAVVDRAVAQSAARWVAIQPYWIELDNYQRYGTFKGLIEGMTSAETKTGAVVGEIVGSMLGLPGIGTMVGGGIGGFFAGKRLGEQAKQLDAVFRAEINKAVAAANEDYNQQIVPALMVDYKRYQASLATNRGSYPGAYNGSFAGYAIIGLFAIVVLSIAHWGAVALFFKDERTIESTVETASIQRTVEEMVASPRASNVGAYAWPTTESKTVVRLSKDAEYIVAPPDATDAPSGWTQIETDDGRVWVREKDVSIASRAHTETEQTPPQKSMEVQHAFHFGKPSYRALLGTFRPLWLYIVGGLVSLFLGVIYISEDSPGFFRWCFNMMLLLGLGHLLVQGIAWGLFQFFATP